MSRLAENHLRSDLDSEQTWFKYLSVRNPSRADKDRYVRINPETEGTVPKLDEKGQIRVLQEATRRLMTSNTQVKQAARRLISACFYFDVFGDVRENTARDLFEVQGKPLQSGEDVLDCRAVTE